MEPGETQSLFFLNPSVAVIIPAFGRPQALRQAIESVLSQTWTDCGLIVVDDASPTPLWEARQLVEESGHRWIRLPENRGPAAARNAGCREAAEHAWITFLDSDDLWHPEKLSRQMRWHEEHPEMKISQVEESWTRQGQPCAKPNHLEQASGDCFAESVQRCAIGPSCVALAADLWTAMGGFDERFRVCEDYELWLRITAKYPVGRVPGDPLVEKRGGAPDQLSTSVPALDRHRLAALLKLVASGSLTPRQEQVAGEGLRRRARILARGAARRGRDDWARFFARIESGVAPIDGDAVSRALEYADLPEA